MSHIGDETPTQPLDQLGYTPSQFQLLVKLMNTQVEAVPTAVFQTRPAVTEDPPEYPVKGCQSCPVINPNPRD